VQANPANSVNDAEEDQHLPDKPSCQTLTGNTDPLPPLVSKAQPYHFRRQQWSLSRL